MAKQLRNSVITICDDMSCDFANGDYLTVSNMEINLTLDACKNGVSGICISFDWYDAKAENTFCDYCLFQTHSGQIYELLWYAFDENEEWAYVIDDFEYDSDNVLATLPLHPNTMQWWHAIYDAIQKIDMR